MGQSGRRTVLAQSDHLALVHEWERVEVEVERAGWKSSFPLVEHCGDPTAGLIGDDESWVCVVGEGIVLHEMTGGTSEYWRGSDPRFVHSARLQDDGIIRVLVDPWSEHASVWVIDPRTKELRKLHDGPSLSEEPYRDEVDF